MEIQFTDALDPASANDPKNYAVKIWSLRRSANYGSPHLNEHSLTVSKATLAADKKSVVLHLPELQPTWSMEILCHLRGTNGVPFTRTVHNTIHHLGSTAGDP